MKSWITAFVLPFRILLACVMAVVYVLRTIFEAVRVRATSNEQEARVLFIEMLSSQVSELVHNYSAAAPEVLKKEIESDILTAVSLVVGYEIGIAISAVGEPVALATFHKGVREGVEDYRSFHERNCTRPGCDVSLALLHMEDTCQAAEEQISKEHDLVLR
jgi:hypothetical protein